MTVYLQNANHFRKNSTSRIHLVSSFGSMVSIVATLVFIYAELKLSLRLKPEYNFTQDVVT
jgi:hypothetical protein